jgi:hypothetical protein
MSPEFAALYDRHVASSFDKQMFLFDLVGNKPWKYETESGMLRFGDEIAWHAQVLGTQSDLSKTWLWSWANDKSNLPDKALTFAKAMRNIGEARKIPELLKPQYEVTPQLQGHDLAIVAAGVCGAKAYYRGPFEGGAIYLLIDDEEFPPNIVDPAPRMAMTFIQMVSAYRCTHAKALAGYASHYGMQHRQEEPNKMSIYSEGKRVLWAEFDDKGRITQLQHEKPPEE